ncbi:MAG TPA: hypothetical protein VHP11_16205 [Tepidisphaeraceae bacterium]|nr:hypothetical protein [Tepidisphaeraceae bacterium]
MLATNRWLAAFFIWMASVVLPAMASGQEGKMSYLDNGIIRLGVNLEVGGAITYLSKAGDTTNLVNNWDWGRQIQMSHYSGPVPFLVPGKEPAPQWRGLGWNPVQAGDHFKNRSKILAHENDGKSIYVKCIPMQWPLDNVPADCIFESRITLERNTAHVSGRMIVQRSDKTQYSGRGQELPAVYTIGTLYRLMTYAGDKPFANEPLSRIEKSEEQKRKDNFPWAGWQATENWAALVNDNDWGLGIWHPGAYKFIGGFAGKPGQGGTHDDPTGYIAPLQEEIIDHNIEYAYQYVLILGSLQEIRQYVYQNAQRPVPPAWRFEKDRQHWQYRDAIDTGWPIQGELHVLLEGQRPQLIGPAGFWLAKGAPKLRIEAACHTQRTQATVGWKRFDEDHFTPGKSVTFAIKPDGQYHTYEIDLSASPEYRGAITGLRLEPVPAGGKGEWIKIKSISFR